MRMYKKIVSSMPRIRFMGPSIRRLLLFVLIPAFGIVSPLLALPALTREHGSEAWADIALGQSLGMAFAVIAELGWGLDGPQRVSRVNVVRAGQYAALAGLTRFVVWVPSAAIAGAFAWLLTPYDSHLSAMAAVSASASALSFSWFFIGRGIPRAIIVSETVPKLLGAISATILLVMGSPAIYYPIVAILVPSLLASVIGSILAGCSWASLKNFSWRRRIKIIRCSGAAVVARLSSAAYITIPTTLVGIVSPSSVALFASTDRLARMALSILAAIPNFLQGWVGKSQTPHLKATRVRSAIIGNVVVGVVAGSVFSLFVPYVSQFTFSGTTNITGELAWMSGCLIAIVCTSRATGNIALVASRKVRLIALSSFVGAIVGLPMVGILARHFGPAGGVAGILTAELCVLTVQCVALCHSSLPRIRQAATRKAMPALKE